MRDISIHVCLSCTHSFHNIFCTHITPARWTTFSPTSSWCGLGPSVRTVLMLTGESLCPSLFNMMSAQTIQNQFRIRDISSSFCACFAHPNRSRSPKMHCIHLLVSSFASPPACSRDIPHQKSLWALPLGRPRSPRRARGTHPFALITCVSRVLPGRVFSEKLLSVN